MSDATPARDDATEVEDAWAAEIERRCDALDAGTTGTIPWEDVQRELEAKFRRK
jgi:putative addiction module component (TIGR02574 family)